MAVVLLCGAAVGAALQQYCKLTGAQAAQLPASYSMMLSRLVGFACLDVILPINCRLPHNTDWLLVQPDAAVLLWQQALAQASGD